jgi:hypothetical protein
MQHLGLPPLSHAFFFLFLAIHDTRSWIPFSDFLMARGKPTTGGLRFGRDGRTSNTGLRVKISYAVEREVTVFLAGKRTPVAGGRGGLPSDGRGVRWWNYTMVRSHERTTAGRGGEGGAEAAAWRRRKRGREGGVPERVIVVVVWWEEVEESKVGSSMRVKQTHTPSQRPTTRTGQPTTTTVAAHSLQGDQSTNQWRPRR